MVRVGAEELCWDDKECIFVHLEHCMVIFLRQTEFGTFFTEIKKQNIKKGSQHATRGCGVEGLGFVVPLE